VGPGFNAGVLGPERVGGCGAYLCAAELPAGSSGAGGCGVSGLLLGAVELGLEVEDRSGADPLDGLVLLRHHRRLRQPSQRLHPPLPQASLLLRGLGMGLRRPRRGRRGRCRQRHRGGAVRATRVGSSARRQGRPEEEPTGGEGKGGEEKSVWAGLVASDVLERASGDQTLVGPLPLRSILGPRDAASNREPVVVPEKKYFVAPPSARSQGRSNMWCAAAAPTLRSPVTAFSVAETGGATVDARNWGIDLI
jgi:hypothetical protein